MLDESEFLSPYGIRALSQFHRDNPYRLRVQGMEHRVDYEPGESSHRIVRRQLQLARTDLVPGELTCWSSRCRSFITTSATDFKVEFPPVRET